MATQIRQVLKLEILSPPNTSDRDEALFCHFIFQDVDACPLRSGPLEARKIHMEIPDLNPDFLHPGSR